MRIGITERGDASLDYTWVNKLLTCPVDGAILITKNITDEFIMQVLRCYEEFKNIVVHCTCTGLGGSTIEPNVPSYRVQLMQFKHLIACGFPKEKCVLRIDPIIPTDYGINALTSVMEYARGLNLLPDIRVRVSVVDNYKHVSQRFVNAGLQKLYGGAYSASESDFNRVNKWLSKYPDVKFECCAENKLVGDNIEHCGCVSKKEIELFHIDADVENMDTNPQNRAMCKCLSCKVELLENRRRCTHGCLYCYWRS